MESGYEELSVVGREGLKDRIGRDDNEGVVRGRRNLE